MLAPGPVWRRWGTGRAAEPCGGTVSEVPLAPGDFAVGSQIAGYQIEEQIGRGGMAVVYRAFDPRLDRSVALKILAPELANDIAFRERFNREMRSAAAVDHPHIVPVYDAGEVNGSLFIAMRYVSGQDLRTLPPARSWAGSPSASPSSPPPSTAGPPTTTSGCGDRPCSRCCARCAVARATSSGSRGTPTRCWRRRSSSSERPSAGSCATPPSAGPSLSRR